MHDRDLMLSDLSDGLDKTSNTMTRGGRLNIRAHVTGPVRKEAPHLDAACEQPMEPVSMAMCIFEPTAAINSTNSRAPASATAGCRAADKLAP